MREIYVKYAKHATTGVRYHMSHDSFDFPPDKNKCDNFYSLDVTLAFFDHVLIQNMKHNGIVHGSGTDIY